MTSVNMHDDMLGCQEQEGVTVPQHHLVSYDIRALHSESDTVHRSMYHGDLLSLVLVTVAPAL